MTDGGFNNGLDVSQVAGAMDESTYDADTDNYVDGLDTDAVGNGLTGGGASAVSVQADSTTGGDTVAVAVSANGVGVDVSGIAGVSLAADGSGALDVTGVAGTLYRHLLHREQCQPSDPTKTQPGFLVTFTRQPVATEWVEFISDSSGPHRLTAVAAGATSGEFNIGGSVAASLTSFGPEVATVTSNKLSWAPLEEGALNTYFDTIAAGATGVPIVELGVLGTEANWRIYGTLPIRLIDYSAATDYRDGAGSEIALPAADPTNGQFGPSWTAATLGANARFLTPTGAVSVMSNDGTNMLFSWEPGFSILVTPPSAEGPTTGHIQGHEFWLTNGTGYTKQMGYLTANLREVLTAAVTDLDLTNRTVLVGSGTRGYVKEPDGDVLFGGYAISNVGTVDGRDIATDGAKLDGIEGAADVTDLTNVAAALNVTEAQATATSAGAADASKLAKLDAAGQWAKAMIPDGADGTAIHTDGNGEIAGVTAKGSPVGGDYVLIEDSAASNVKKSMTLTALAALLAGSGLTASTGVISVSGGSAISKAVISFTGNAATLTLTNQNQWYQITTFATNNVNRGDFTADQANDRITVGNGFNDSVELEWNVCFTLDANSQVIEFGVSQDGGSTIETPVAQRKAGTGADVGSASMQTVVGVNASGGDKQLTLWARNTTSGADTLTVSECYFEAKEA